MIDALRASLSPTKPAPHVTFGPFLMLEAIPWLMLASSLRFLAYVKPGLAGALFAAASISLFLAFVLGARRMIELAEGQTGLGSLNFTEQLRLARAVVGRVVLLLIAAFAAAIAVGERNLAPHLLLGFDGIAFDQFSRVGMVWSSVLACIVFLMVVRADRDGRPALLGALGDLGRRAAWLAPAILAVVMAQYGLTFVQGLARSGVRVYYFTSPAPTAIKNLLYFLFVFGFATIRLWLTLAILTFGLRESYRRQGG